MKLSVLSPIIAIMTLAACTTNHIAVAPLALADEIFECHNGMTLTIRHNAGTDKINLSVDTIGNTATLTRMVSGSGVRFTSSDGLNNQTTEFHTKGNMGYFTFRDAQKNLIETHCQKKS